MKTLRNIMLGILCLALVSVGAIGITYKINTSAVDSSDSEKILVVIPEKATVKQIGEILKEKDLIRSSTFFNIYTKLFKKDNLKASTYYLSRDMDLEEILDTLAKGNTFNEEQISITFKEGINIRDLAKIIDENTNNTYDDVMKLVNDEKYLNELVEKYWFITDDVKNKDLYYGLEGYLAPNTYFYSGKSVSVKDIFSKMLNQTDKILSKYKDVMKEKNLSVHYVLTLASVIEKEGKRRDFKDISSVFYNRISKDIKFQSCATAIYGSKREFDSIENRVITSDIMNHEDLYNTYIVQVPVGPICLPSEDAIEAAVYPNMSDYLYFLSDNQGKTYFFSNYSDHQKKQKELQQAGKWN